MTTAPRIVTDRLVLRMPVAEDFDTYGDVLMSDRARFMGGPFSLEAAWKEFATEVGSWALHGLGGWSITDRITGAWLGSVQVNIRPDFPEREMGWVISGAAEGAGFAREAATAVRDHVFGALKWKTLVSYISPDNARSIALARRLGGFEDGAVARPHPEDLVYRYTPETAA